MVIMQHVNSNTTLVKVKSSWVQKFTENNFYSNTTLVKVKLLAVLVL